MIHDLLFVVPCMVANHQIVRLILGFILGGLLGTLWCICVYY
jgi:TRAP-type C4-dicarboxylate transport system permease large subunit